MKDLIGICGLDCEKCDAYIATKTNDNTLREKTAKLWSKLNGVEIPTEMINCEGCRTPGAKTVYCSEMCEIKKCAEKKGCKTCADCSHHGSCETLKPVTDNTPEALENLKR